MSLRTRVWLLVGALVVIPLLVGGLVTARLVSKAQDNEARSSLRAASASVAAGLSQTCRTAGLAARMLLVEATGPASSPSAAAAKVVDGGYADYAAVLGPDGKPVGEAGEPPAVPPDELGSCSSGEAPQGSASAVVAERVDSSGAESPVAVAATTLDAATLDALRNALELDASITLADGSQVVATTDPATAAALAGQTPDDDGFLTADGQLAFHRAPSGAVPYAIVVAEPAPSVERLQQAILAAVLIATILAIVLGWQIARGLTRPLAEVTGAAERVAVGNLDQTIDVRSHDEVGRLGLAFNRMTAELRRNLNELERSRDEMRGSLERLGETLGSTHDLDGLLQVVLETAVRAARARGGVALASDTAGVLNLYAEQGLEEQGLHVPVRIPVGEGVLGRVAASGEPVRGRLGEGAAARVGGDEPSTGDVLAVPLRRGARVVGVLALYGRQDSSPFGAEDERAIRTLAGQAGIAVDNVLLHNEAQRLSITDALTGLWNFRYLSMSLAREIERATRFARPLAVLMLDLDNFKAVNDQHGHARGDAVLRETAARVGEQIREVDTLARYGGEEFVLVLPETTSEGAGMLAERVCAAIRREPFGGDEGEPPLQVTVSIGVASFPEHGASAATLMRTADQALYAAKRAGRDRWVVAAPANHPVNVGDTPLSS